MINRVILVGNVGQDPEISYTVEGTAVAKFSLATSESWKDKQTGEKVQKTEWHRIVSFGRQAEVIRDYVKKGSKLYLEGKIVTDKWQDKQGADRYTTNIVAKIIQMLDSKPKEEAPASQHAYQKQADQQATPKTVEHVPEFDDDIPF